MNQGIYSLLLGQQDPISKLLPKTDEQLRNDAMLRGDFKTANKLASPDPKVRKAVRPKARATSSKSPSELAAEKRKATQAKMQAQRGGKSVAATEKANPNSWEHAVTTGAKVLGLKPGSKEEALMRSAMWLANYSEGPSDPSKVRPEDANRVLRLMQTPEGQAKLEKDVEAYKAARSRDAGAPKVKAMSPEQLAESRWRSGVDQKFQDSGVPQMLGSIDANAAKMKEQARGVVKGALPGAHPFVTEFLPDLAVDVNPFVSLPRGAAHLMGVPAGIAAGDPGLALNQAGLSALNLADAFGVDTLGALVKGGKDAVLAFKALRDTGGMAKAVKAAEQAGLDVAQINKLGRAATKADMEPVTAEFRSRPSEFEDKPLGVKYRKPTYEGEPAGSRQANEGTVRQTVRQYDDDAGRARFHEGLTRVNREHKYGKAVTVKPAEHYRNPNVKVFLSDDGLAGAAVEHDGDLVSVFRHQDSKATINDVLESASSHAVKLDAYSTGGKLPDIYSQHGFTPVARVKFNDAYAPDGWDYDLFGRPDIVLMAKSASRSSKPYKSIEHEIPLFDDYDEALKLQAKAVSDYKSSAANAPVPQKAKNVTAQVTVPKGITHAETEQVRQVLGMPRYDKSRKPVADLINEARSVNARAVVDDVLAKTRPMSDKEQAAVAVHIVEKSNEAKALADKFSKAVDSGDIDSVSRLGAEIESSNGDILRALDASDKAGTEMGRALASRKLEIGSSDEPWALQYRHYKATGSKPGASFQKLIDEVQSLKKQLEEATAGAAKADVSSGEKVFARAAKARVVNYRRATTKTGYEQAVKTWQRSAVGATKRRGAVMAPSEEQWKALKYIARYHFDNGVESFSEAVQRVIEATGVDDLLATRAVRSAILDDSRLANYGRLEGEEFMSRGANALESPEVRRLRFEFDRKKAEANDYLLKAERDAAFRQKNMAQKSVAVLSDVVGTTRTVLTSGDMSAVFRQGLSMWFAQPGKSARAMQSMFRSIGEKGYEKAMWEVTQSPHYNEAVSAKLALTDAMGGILPHEEAFVSNLLKNVPGIKQLTGASERTYTAYLNNLRMSVFSGYVDLLESSGAKLTRDDLTSLAEWVNTATGRSNLGSAESVAGGLAKWFFAPRFLWSRVKMLTATPVFKATPATRALIAKEYAKAVSGTAITLGLAKMASYATGGKIDTEQDLRSSHWGKVKVGQNEYDVTGGMAGVGTFMARMASYMASSVDENVDVRKRYDGSYSGRKDPFSSPMNMGMQFLVGKSSPPARVLYHGLTKKDFKGDDTTMAKEAGKALVPIGVQSAIERRGQSASDQLAAFLAEFFGFGVSPVPDGKPKPKK